MKFNKGNIIVNTYNNRTYFVYTDEEKGKGWITLIRCNLGSSHPEKNVHKSVIIWGGDVNRLYMKLTEWVDWRLFGNYDTVSPARINGGE